MEVTALGALLTLLLTTGVVHDDPSGRLYGRVSTTEGTVLEGYLRWDRNEATWTDFLDGTKEIPPERVREAERLDPAFAERQRRERSIVAFGVRITWDEDDQSGPPTRASGIRFGHLESLEILDEGSALLRLRGGGEAVLHGSSSDLGRAMRDLVVERPDGRMHELEWSDLERVDFFPAPDGTPAPASHRLHGTLTTWGGLELTGDIAWDRDEILGEDVLDGRAEGEDVRIAFSEIVSIEWESDRSARVGLRSGEELVVRGSNDVNLDNRGIEISDSGFGRAVVRWEDFRSVRFHRPAERRAWPTTPPGHSVHGVVRALDGRIIEGEVRWGIDETNAWETLDGRSGDAELAIELGAIRTIERIQDDGVTVTLLDGRVFELSDSDDVDERVLGVFVQPQGQQRRLVRWRDLHRLELIW